MKKGVIDSKWLLWGVVTTIGIIHGFFAVSKGIITECPDCNSYAAAADKIVALGFNIFELGRENKTGILVFVSHLGFKTIVAFSKALFGSQWAAVILGYNLLMHVGTALLILWLVRKATQDNWAVLIAGFLFLVSAETLLWVNYVLTDSSYMGISFVALCLTVLASEAKNITKKIWFLWTLVVGSVFICLIYRPTGMLVGATALIGLVLFLSVDPKNLQERAHWGRHFISYFLGISLVGFFLMAYLLQNPSLWKLNLFSDVIELASNLSAQGVVIKDRPWSFHESPQTYSDYLYLIADRFLHFFTFYVDGFSVKHNILNIAFFPAGYIFSFVSFVALFRKDSGLSPVAWRISFLCSMFILMTAFFHSILIIDYDWRFRLPCLPPLIILAAIGVAQIKHYYAAQGVMTGKRGVTGTVQ